MKLKWLISAFAVAITFAGCSGDEETQTVQPQSRGQRGEACQARNDCQSGLACISGICSRNDFDVSVTAKHCDRIECTATADCCGDKPLTTPPGCENRALICETPTLPGCIQTFCTSDAACGTGTCGTGFCSNGTGGCTEDSECTDTCVAGYCSKSNFSCLSDVYCDGIGTCGNRLCDCTNPLYDPTNPVCTNPACVDVCELTCEDELCIVDTSCQTDADCVASSGRICNAGKCVECVVNEDCAVADGESCVEGKCEKPCKFNEECPYFHRCEAGECIETGCTSDRECVLAASAGTNLGEDARLLKCLPSDDDPNIKTCKIPCENDGSCAEFEVCEAGYCKFIGCDTDEECRSFLGVANEDTNDEKPYITRAVCRE